MMWDLTERIQDMTAQIREIREEQKNHRREIQKINTNLEQGNELITEYRQKVKILQMN